VCLYEDTIASNRFEITIEHCVSTLYTSNQRYGFCYGSAIPAANKARLPFLPYRHPTKAFPNATPPLEAKAKDQCHKHERVPFRCHRNLFLAFFTLRRCPFGKTFRRISSFLSVALLPDVFLRNAGSSEEGLSNERSRALNLGQARLPRPLSAAPSAATSKGGLRLQLSPSGGEVPQHLDEVVGEGVQVDVELAVIDVVLGVRLGRLVVVHQLHHLQQIILAQLLQPVRQLLHVYVLLGARCLLLYVLARPSKRIW